MKLHSKNNITTVAQTVFVSLNTVTSRASSHSPACSSILELIRSAVRHHQNKPIRHQNAQKILKNEMTELKLNEIFKWSDFYTTLYRKYYSEFKEVKHVIKQYNRIREITRMQGLLVSDYQKVWWLLQIDPNFSAEELLKMSRVYEGILNISLTNTDLLIHIISSFSASMSDNQRLEIINRVGDQIEKNYRDLQHFNRAYIFITLQRADSQSQLQHLKKIYEINP